MFSHHQELTPFQYKSTFIAVGGPSGVGKTSVINSLIESLPHMFMRPVSYTTRARRIDESEEEYHFVSVEQIIALHEQGNLLNFDHTYGNIYGISRESVEQGLKQGRNPIKEIHPSNLFALQRTLPDMLSILLLVDEVQSDQEARTERRQQDIAYYSGIDSSSFDIVRTVYAGESPSEIAAMLGQTICATLSTRHYFPASPEIDAFNLEGYNLIAEEFVDEKRVTTANFHQLSETFFRASIQRHITSESRCLEVGPGSGWLQKHFIWPSCEKLFVDISPAMKLTHSENMDGQYLISSVRNIRVETASVDAVFASLCDPYCYPTALCELHRVLKHGGRLFISLPAREWAESARHDTDRMMTTFTKMTGGPAKVYSFTFSNNDLKALLELCGFSMVIIETICGATLSSSPISPVISTAAAKLGCPLSQMGILQVAHAVK